MNKTRFLSHGLIYYIYTIYRELGLDAVDVYINFGVWALTLTGALFAGVGVWWNNIPSSAPVIR